MAKQKKQGKLKKKKQSTKKQQSSSNAPNASTGIADLYTKIVENGPVISLILIAVIGFIVFANYLLFNKLFLFRDIGSDSINIFHPTYAHLADYVRTNGLPKWSFQQGLGQNILPHSLGNPFHWLYIMVGSKSLPFAYAWVEYLKILLTGFVVFKYLRTIKYDSYVSTIGALLFSFSGFMIIGSSWYVFSTQALQFACLLLAIERLMQGRDYWMFPLFICIIAATLPFDLFLFCEFLGFYVLFRFIDQNGLDLKKFGTLVLQIVGLGAIGVGMSSIFLFSNIQEILQSPRVGGDSSLSAQLIGTPIFDRNSPLNYVTTMMRLFGNDIMGGAVQFKGWRNYLEAPMLYVGIPTLLLCPQLLMGKLSKSKRILFALPLIFVGLMLAFPWFRYAFWIFSGDYYRLLSLFVGFVLLYYALRVLAKDEQLKNINLPLHGVVTLILLGVLFFVNATYPKTISGGQFGIALFFLLASSVLIGITAMGKLNYKTFRVGFLVLICVELLSTSYSVLNNRTAVTAAEYKKKMDYNDYTVDAINSVKAQDKDFFRVTKNYASGGAIHGSLNDSKMQGYYGTSCYHSFNQKYYIEFLQAVGAINATNESQTRWAVGIRNRPLLETFTSVKYKVMKFKQGAPQNAGFGFTKLNSFGDVTLFQNSNALPLGFAYQEFITRSQFAKLPQIAREIALFRGVVVEDSEVGTYTGYGMRPMNLGTIPRDPAQLTPQVFSTDVNARRADGMKMKRHGQNLINGTVNLNAKKAVLFTIPYDTGWKATVDGKEVPIQKMSIGFTGIMVDAGQHEIELRYFPTLFYPGLLASLLFLAIFGFLVWKFRPEKTVEEIVEENTEENEE